ncbi:MAG: hypothetical protein M1819_000149 [Sarea resinae]|nr:MAG: hypothetical protein M1819_000149 [Sarea resinae]
MAAPGPSFMTSEQVGQQPPPSNVSASARPYGSSWNRPGPATTKPVSSSHDSQRDWTANYLSDLRSHRVARPSGARPFPSIGVPGRAMTPNPTSETAHSSRVPSAVTFVSTQASELPPRSASAQSHRRAQSASSMRSSLSGNGGRPLVQQPHAGVTARDFSASSAASTTVQPTDMYRESGQRWMERQEARSLREALEDMDLKDEIRLHSAAQDEASELILKHQNRGLPSRNSGGHYDYKQHLRKGSHARSQSIGKYSGSEDGSGPGRNSRHVSNSSTSTSATDSSQGGRISSDSSVGLPDSAGHDSHGAQRRGVNVGADGQDNKSYKDWASFHQPSTSSHRRTSSGSKYGNLVTENGRGIFRNPDDQIYEEPEEESGEPDGGSDGKLPMPAPLKVKPRNSLSKVQFAASAFERSNNAQPVENQKVNRYEIHRNPPSQSRNPEYSSNSFPPTSSGSADTLDKEDKKNDEMVPMKNGIEVRSDEIRAATSMRLKDRSPKLPTPTIVSDKASQPIVSFDPSWKPRETQSKQEESRIPTDSSTRALPERPGKSFASRPAASAPIVPTINVSEPPSIRVNDTAAPPIPIINVPDSSDNAGPAAPSKVGAPPRSSTRPLPTPTGRSSRPFPRHAATAPSSTPHYSPSVRRPTAACTQCSLPITGRTVSAAGQRFHPECFVCYNCGEGLECVAFYPEPDAKRAERVDRIRRRARGEPVDEVDGKGEADDGTHDARAARRQLREKL